MDKPHGCDLRKGRISLLNQAYLITTATLRRQPMFVNLKCARIVVRAMMSEQHNVATLAFVVMPDHLHWMLQLTTESSIDGVVRRMKSISSHRINIFLNRSGSIWQAGFHDHALRRDEDLRQVAEYVIQNPLRAGLVKHIGEYPHWDGYWL